MHRPEFVLNLLLAHHQSWRPISLMVYISRSTKETGRQKAAISDTLSSERHWRSPIANHNRSHSLSRSLKTNQRPFLCQDFSEELPDRFPDVARGRKAETQSCSRLISFGPCQSPQSPNRQTRRPRFRPAQPKPGRRRFSPTNQDVHAARFGTFGVGSVTCIKGLPTRTACAWHSVPSRLSLISSGVALSMLHYALFSIVSQIVSSALSVSHSSGRFM
jgi:hypothetical protein